LRLTVVILSILGALLFNRVAAQSYIYSYTDPCTGVEKSIAVPINGDVTVGYYGFVNNFSANDFNDGTFEAWTTNVFSQYGGDSPCSQIVGIGNTLTVSQSTTITVLGILNSLSSVSDIASVAGGTNILAGAVNTTNSSSESGSGEGEKKGSNSTQQSGGATTTSGTTTSGSTTTQGGGTTQSGSTESGTQSSEQSAGSGTVQGGTEQGSTETQTTTGNENSGNTGSSTESGSNTGTGTSGTSGSGSGSSETPETPTTTTTEEGKGQTNITGGATTTTKAVAAGKSEGGKPTVVASSDFVGFNFKNSDVDYGLKFTGGYSAVRWDGKRASGVTADYTSALRGPNITGYYAWIKKRSVGLLSLTGTFGFEGRGSLYGTIAGGQMISFPKVKRLKAVWMATATYGQVYKTPFLGTAVIVGGMYDWRVAKRLDIKITNLLVYAPYVSYYNDVVLKSPYVMLPSLGVNIGITKRFKFNINAGGAWSMQDNALNYTVTCGTRMLVGQ